MQFLYFISEWPSVFSQAKILQQIQNIVSVKIETVFKVSIARV